MASTCSGCRLMIATLAVGFLSAAALYMRPTARQLPV